MPDEATPQSEDTSQVSEVSEETTESQDSKAPEVDWQERYSNLQPEYTRATQEAAQYRQIVELARQGDPQALDYLGIQLDDDDEDEMDEIERLERLESAFVNRLQAEQEQQERQEYEQAETAYLSSQLDELENKHGKIDDNDLEALYYLAQSLRDENGFPNLIKAFEYDSKRLESQRARWVESKRSPQAPSGASASHQVDLDDPNQRREYLAQRVQGV